MAFLLSGAARAATSGAPESPDAPKSAAAGTANKGVHKGAGKHLTSTEKEARAFLDIVNPLLVPVATVQADVAWSASTDVSPEHTGARMGADRALAALSGSKIIIERCKTLLARRKDLDDVTARQLQKLLLSAAEAPGTIPAVVAKKIEAEARQAALQDGYTFCLQPKPGNGGGCARTTTANEIDNTLVKSRDLAERQRVWTVSKELGRPLKPGLVELQQLRNQVARELGHSSFFGLQVADYGMTVKEMMDLLDATLATTKPLYQGLHCWAKYTLAKRFNRPVPKLLPAHWLGNRWAQRWPDLVEGTSLDQYFKGAKPETIVKSAETFYTSLGFPPLPASFWTKSDLYPVAPGQPRKKNSHASAWHIDHEQDVRSLMSVESNEQWFGTAHHELGHIYYFLAYSRPEVPPVLREGANRAFHEAIGELARLAASQTPYLHKVGVLPANVNPDAHAWLLQSALDAMVFLPFSAGTMSHFERDLYEGELPSADWQKRWWDYVARYQGVSPPGDRPRPEDGCDACTKTHINDDPGQYYDYALAWLIKFQLHDHICTKILKQDVRACDYSGQKAVGDFLRGILSLGATRDWRAVIKEATGEEISPRAMMAFYAPLVDDLAKQNAGRDCSWEN
ncbi:MAG: M2 family metallopeptidase [Myxococcales bacterium]